MTPKEFKLWFDGLVTGADEGGLTADALERLAEKVESIEETTGYRPMPQHPPGTVVWEPCKTVPLGSTQTFDPSVVYNNGATAVHTTGQFSFVPNGGSATRAGDK